jgi:bifunctional DNase/RNase
MVEMSVLGISLQEKSGTPVLLLHPHGTRRILAVAVGPMEALAVSAILRGDANPLHGRGGTEEGKKGGGRPGGLFPRPLTHDLLFSVLSSLGGVLVSVEFLAVVEGAFIAEAVIMSGVPEAHEVRVDCRPSDGVALALRCGATILASAPVLAHAEDMETVMAGLPRYVRDLAAANLAAADKDGEGKVFFDPPLAIEGVLAVRREFSGSDPRQELISVARQMLEEERARDKGRGAGLRKNFPQIRLSGNGAISRAEPDFRDELSSPAKALTEDILSGLGLSLRDQATIAGSPAGERWTMLLRLLSPETKVVM